MSEAPKIQVKGKTDPDAVTVFVDKEIYAGWEDCQFTRELNTVASDFQLRLTDRWKPNQAKWTIQSGNAVHIHMGGQSVLTGWVDTTTPSFNANSRSIVVRGRSKACDLVDCSVTGANEYLDVNLNGLVQKLLAPFKIPVYFKASAGANFAKITVKQGETVYSLIDRLAKQRNLVMIPNVEGGIEFVTVGGKRAGTDLVQGVNVLSGSSNSDKTNRYSEYIVKGQNLSFLGEPLQSSTPQGNFTDEGVTRYRPLVIVNNAASDDTVTGNRAQYEANIRAAKSLEAEVEVQGWFKKDGKLWDINEEVFCDIGFLGLRRVMLVKKVVFNKNASGTTCVLSLIRKDAYDFTVKNKKLKKEDDLSWLKSAQGYQKPSSFYERAETRQ